MKEKTKQQQPKQKIPSVGILRDIERTVGNKANEKKKFWELKLENDKMKLDRDAGKRKKESKMKIKWNERHSNSNWNWKEKEMSVKRRTSAHVKICESP